MRTFRPQAKMHQHPMHITVLYCDGWLQYSIEMSATTYKPCFTLFLTFLAVEHVESFSLRLQLISQREFAARSLCHPRRKVDCSFHSHDESGTHPHRRFLDLRGGSSNDSPQENEDGPSPPRFLPQLAEQLHKFFDKNFFLLGMFVAVGLARAMPSVSHGTVALAR
jgi:hypothetical protein